MPEPVENPFRGASAARRYAAGRLPVHEEFVRRILWGLGDVRPRRALDLGCGTGLSTVPLAAAAGRAVGCDVSRPMLGEAARRSGPAWARARAEALPFRAGAFDLVTLACVFHWCDADALLASVRRVLAADGHLAVYDHALAGGGPGFEAWHAAFKERFPPAPRHAHFDAARAKGFVPVARERFEHPVPLTPAGLLHYVTSQSNVLAAVEAGRVTLEAAERELRPGIARLFGGGGEARFLYRGELDVLCRA